MFAESALDGGGSFHFQGNPRMFIFRVHFQAHACFMFQLGGSKVSTTRLQRLYILAFIFSSYHVRHDFLSPPRTPTSFPSSPTSATVRQSKGCGEEHAYPTAWSLTPHNFTISAHLFQLAKSNRTVGHRHGCQKSPGKAPGC
jgi:hypothetical protein